MQLIVKPEFLDKCSTFLDHKGVDLNNKNTTVKPKNMNIGFGARSLLTELGRKDNIVNFISDIRIYNYKKIQFSIRAQILQNSLQMLYSLL